MMPLDWRSVFEQYRTDKLNANSFANNARGLAKPELRRHDFGGNFGGPLVPRGARLVHAAAHHLLDLRGKHLRPTCVALSPEEFPTPVEISEAEMRAEIERVSHEVFEPEGRRGEPHPLLCSGICARADTHQRRCACWHRYRKSQIRRIPA